MDQIPILQSSRVRAALPLEPARAAPTMTFKMTPITTRSSSICNFRRGTDAPAALIAPNGWAHAP